MQMPEKTPLTIWLDRKFLEWQTNEGESKNVSEFADYLDVNRSLLSFWMNGAREPNEENLIKIAFKLGFEIYDILEIKRPNILHLYAQRNWDKAPKKVQQELAKIISKYTDEPIPDETREKQTTKP